eukprot:1389134-Pyramimonas_sp.AAC.1
MRFQISPVRRMRRCWSSLPYSARDDFTVSSEHPLLQRVRGRIHVRDRLRDISVRNADMVEKLRLVYASPGATSETTMN